MSYDEELYYFANLVMHEIAATMCPFCLSYDENLYHMFFSCSIAFKLWEWMIKWSSILIHIPVLCADLVEMLELKDRSYKVTKLKLSLLYNTVDAIERKEWNHFPKKGDQLCLLQMILIHALLIISNIDLSWIASLVLLAYVSNL